MQHLLAVQQIQKQVLKLLRSWQKVDEYNLNSVLTIENSDKIDKTIIQNTNSKNKNISIRFNAINNF